MLILSPLARSVLGRQAFRRGLSESVGKPRVVVVGTGWAGSRVARDLDVGRLGLTVISTRNHVVFTPLLAQTTTGTLEFRTVCEAIRKIQPGLARPGNEFYMAAVRGLARERGVVLAEAVDPGGCGVLYRFEVPFDYLVLAHGAQPRTFGTPGVEEHCWFLREVSDARGIRMRILRNLALASLPGAGEKEQRRLMRTVVVGGGPIGTEFAADLCDFMREDVAAYFPRLKDRVGVTLVEPHEVLGSFEAGIRKYVMRHFDKQGVEIVKSTVKEVTKDEVILKDGRVISCGLVVWGTGVGPAKLTQSLGLDCNSAGRLDIDPYLRVKQNGEVVPNIFALGDCAGELPALAAVANQQGKYLARRLNGGIGEKCADEPFRYRHLGSMIMIGGFKAVADLTTGPIKGLTAFLLWRSAYFTMIGTVRSRMYMALNWLGSFVFGRDFSFILDMDQFRRMEAKRRSDEAQVNR